MTTDIVKGNKEATRLEIIEAARIADVEHRKIINNAILDAFVNIGLSVEISKIIMQKIILNEIPNVSINY